MGYISENLVKISGYCLGCFAEPGGVWLSLSAEVMCYVSFTAIANRPMDILCQLFHSFSNL